MDNIVAWMEQTQWGHVLWTMLISMVPVIELRGGIPAGIAMGLHPLVAMLASIVGNLLPVPFIIIFLRRVFDWLRKRAKFLDSLLNKLERRAHLKGEVVQKYSFWGLCLLVAIPLPGTGAWTGALVAVFLDMRLRRAMPAISLGVVIAAVLVLGISLGIVQM